MKGKRRAQSQHSPVPRESAQHTKKPLVRSSGFSLSEFHAVVVWMMRIIVHQDLVSNLLVWAQREVRAVKGEKAASAGIGAGGRHHPPTIERGGFHLHLGDGSADLGRES